MKTERRRRKENKAIIIYVVPTPVVFINPEISLTPWVLNGEINKCLRYVKGL
jgi:hypothetical protein